MDIPAGDGVADALLELRERATSRAVVESGARPFMIRQEHREGLTRTGRGV